MSCKYPYSASTDSLEKESGEAPTMTSKLTLKILTMPSNIIKYHSKINTGVILMLMLMFTLMLMLTPWSATGQSEVLVKDWVYVTASSLLQ